MPPMDYSGYYLDQLLQIVSQLEALGLLNDFIRLRPEYVYGIEVVKAVIQRYRHNSANVRGLAPPQSQVSQAVARPTQVCNTPLVPSAPSVRYFVTQLSQLLEEQCPNRSDPNIILCEDRCLAALQMAVVECLKLVRQKRLAAASPIPVITSPPSP